MIFEFEDPSPLKTIYMSLRQNLTQKWPDCKDEGQFLFTIVLNMPNVGEKRGNSWSARSISRTALGQLHLKLNFSSGLCVDFLCYFLKMTPNKLCMIFIIL